MRWYIAITQGIIITDPAATAAPEYIQLRLVGDADHNGGGVNPSHSTRMLLQPV
jgi:hypothetical protein